MERLLAEEAPNTNGQTRATVIAEALLQQASRGDIRAISEVANRVEGKPVQSHPSGTVEPEALKQLELPRCDTRLFLPRLCPRLVV